MQGTRKVIVELKRIVFAKHTRGTKGKNAGEGVQNIVREMG